MADDEYHISSQPAKLVGIWLIFGCFLVVRFTMLFQRQVFNQISPLQSWSFNIVWTSGFQPNFNAAILTLFQPQVLNQVSMLQSWCCSMLCQHQLFNQISMLQSWTRGLGGGGGAQGPPEILQGALSGPSLKTAVTEFFFNVKSFLIDYMLENSC